MTNKIILFLLLLTLLSCSSTTNKNLNSFTSPDTYVDVNISSIDSNLVVNIIYEGHEVNATLDGYGTKINSMESHLIDQNWTTEIGERKSIPDHYEAIKINTKDTENRNLTIHCRIYNEGVALQYEYNPEEFKGIVLQKDPIQWSFEDNFKTWVTANSQGAYQESKINNIKDRAERPLLIQGSENLFYAIGEAAVVNYPRSKITSSSVGENTLTLIPESRIDLEQAKYISPWRFLLVGKSPGTILEHNYILENLNEENQIDDILWVKPGKILREVTLTTTGGKACVDFAVDHNLQYVEFDAGWYGDEYSKEADASTITVDPKRSKGPLDLHEVIAYAKERGIGIILYVNNNAMLKQLDEILPLYQKWGISGVKYGFVNNGSQEWNSWLHEAVRKAADNHLMVDIHDDYRPTGFSRTYPNLLTQEGIRGDEESPSVQHSLYTIFIRGIAGAGDNTNCYLAPRVKDVMGGKGAQMAKSIMIYSPWQFLYWYDRPEKSPRKKGGAGAAQSVLFPDPGYKFYADLPTTWDDTKVLDVLMGEYGMIARKKGEDWFVGGLNANEMREIQFNFDFLDDNGMYDAVVYFQDENALSENKIQIENLDLSKDSKFIKEMPADSGFALILRKKE